MYSIKLTGNIPSKKNSLRRVKRGNRVFTMASQKFEEWHEDALWQLTAASVPKEAKEMVVKIVIIFYSGLNKDGSAGKRKFDLTNKAESVMDLLVDYGYLEDDNFKVVPDLTLRYGRGREEAGCDIHIY